MSKSPLEFFVEISAIPRASGNEAGIAAYLADFAADRGLFCLVDGIKNVFIRKAGSAGREKEPAMLLQAHTDMVAEQDSGTEHDFENEGIKLVVEGNILRADGTTLGADDGFGVALMLAMLDDDALSHPPLECLFTVSEEVGLEGALAFDYSVVTARRMVNLDSAGERDAITGCCGGLRHELTLPITFGEREGDFYALYLGGFAGGHSGEDIHRGRVNAHVMMGKVLRHLKTELPFLISYISGGDKDNAIPRECEVHVCLPAGTDVSGLLQKIRALVAVLVMPEEDKGFTVELSPIAQEPTMSDRDTARILSTLAQPNGVLEWNEAQPSLPELSRNLARIRTKEDAVHIGFSSRSPSAEKIAALRDDLDEFALIADGTVWHHAAYPGWENPKDAAIVGQWQEAYRRVTGEECTPTVIHAGLECGVISNALPGLEAVAVGPNIYDLHTPRERMELDSFDRMAKTLAELLRSC